MGRSFDERFDRVDEFLLPLLFREEGDNPCSGPLADWFFGRESFMERQDERVGILWRDKEALGAKGGRVAADARGDGKTAAEHRLAERVRQPFPARGLAIDLRVLIEREEILAIHGRIELH